MRPLLALSLFSLIAGCGADSPGSDDGSAPDDGAPTADASDAAPTGGDGGGAVGDGAPAPADAAMDLGAPIPDGAINLPDGPIPDGGILVHDGSVVCFPRACQGKVYQCGDCLDNDQDGLIDSEDPDCLGVCQNNESGFNGNIPGQNNAPCKQDCYFDQDTGSGNDGCEWDHGCDPHEQQGNPEIGCAYDPKTKFPGNATCADRAAKQTNQCLTFCGPLTPNGCDCFGCCIIPPNASMTEGVFLGSRDAKDVPTCDLAHAADKTRCRPCQIVPGCFKSCGNCQLCIGKTMLPNDCFPPPPKPDGGVVGSDGGAVGKDGGASPDGGAKPDGGPVAPDGGIPGQCTMGLTPCGVPGQPPCPPFFYCVTGCCQPTIM